MGALETVTQLNDAGRFIEALKALNELTATSASGSAREVLHAELLERVGRFSQARIILQTLMKRKDLDPAERSSCELVLGKIEWEEGLTESAIEHLQRSVQLASEAGDLRRRCWPNMLLLVSLSDRSGPDAVAPILNELRNDATKLGEPLILAALHSYTGQMEAKQGLFFKCSLACSEKPTDSRIGAKPLDRSPNRIHENEYRGAKCGSWLRSEARTPCNRTRRTIGQCCLQTNSSRKSWIRVLFSRRVY